MSKKKLRKEILLSYTKDLDKELKSQEKLKNSKNREIRDSAYHVIGYITAVKYYESIFLDLIKADSKELKKTIKRNKRISKANKKTLNKLFKK